MGERAEVLGIDQPHAFRADRRAFQSVPQAEAKENAGGVGRELKSRADLLQPLGALDERDRKAPRGERQRRRQAGDPGSRDQNGSGTGRNALGSARSRQAARPKKRQPGGSLSIAPSRGS